MNDSSSIAQQKEKPKICAIDLDREIVEAIQAKRLHCFDGTLGSQVKVPNLSIRDAYPCLLNYKFPPNLHEYDIVLIDLQQREPIEYIESDHTRSHSKGSEQMLLLSSYPETIFDPRPLAASLLRNELKSFLTKDTLTIVFSNSNETIEYQPVWMTSQGSRREPNFKQPLYNFLPFIQEIKNKYGKSTKIVSNIPKEIADVLQKYNNQFVYNVTFPYPTESVQDEDNKYALKQIYRGNFIPLIINSDDEIISFLDFLSAPNALFMFPQLKDKKSFIVDLLDSTLPKLRPQIFPFSEQFAWLKSADYFMPNHLSLINSKKELEENHNLALAKIEDRIKQNNVKYQFLHGLISETDDSLVKSVETILSWLGFENIINMDETQPEIKEEDLQVVLDGGLLVVEIKGIGGTSKDADCSQISKIKYRRAKQRGKFDVNALYIVNHQRYLPPHKRKNPPFSEHQINDAQSDERGLLTTYQLFKLYSNIEKGFITKKDARASLLKYGLVQFKPSNSIWLGNPLEIHHGGQVIILRIKNIEISKGVSIIVCNLNDWFKVNIVEIQLNDSLVEKASNSEIGVKLNKPVSKNSELWYQNLIYK